MSEPITTKKIPACGDSWLLEKAAYLITHFQTGVPLFVTGSSNDGVINMATHVGDYTAPLSVDGTFLICIEVAGQLVVQLEDGNDLTITAAQMDAYLGTWYPAKIQKVYKTGSTGSFTSGY